MKGTHIAWVSAQLKKRKVITSMMAFDAVKCTRLAAVICQLRNRGWLIETQLKKSGNGSNYAAYKLIKAPTKG